jgi:hypothetical protein
MPKSKKSRKYVKHNLTDLRKHKITLMVKFGGFSYRAIARNVLGTPFEVDTPEAINERQAIQSYAHREGLRVSDWRNGMSISAQAHISKLLKIKKSLQKQLSKAKKR